MLPTAEESGRLYAVRRRRGFARANLMSIFGSSALFSTTTATIAIQPSPTPTFERSASSIATGENEVWATQKPVESESYRFEECQEA